MPFHITLHDIDNEYERPNFFRKIPDMIVNTDNSQGFLIPATIEYEFKEVKYLYAPTSTFIVTGKNANDSFYYLQQLTPLENQTILTPKIYLKGVSDDAPIVAVVIKWNEGVEMECFTPILPKSKHDYLCVDGKAYKCEKIKLGADKITIDVSARYDTIEDWKDKFIRHRQYH